MGAHLDSAFKALRDGNADCLIPGLDQDQSTRLIEALKALTPSTQGDVDRVEIGGTLVERYRPPVTRRVISARLKIMKGGASSEEPFRVRGVISEADQELCSFKLRDLVHVGNTRFREVDELTFGFDEHVYEIVMEAFNSLERVVVVGEMIAGKNQALDVKFEVPPQPEPSLGDRVSGWLVSLAGHARCADLTFMPPELGALCRKPQVAM